MANDLRPFQETLSIEEAAQLLGISRKTAYKYAKIGELPGVRLLGTRYKVSKKLLEDWLDGKQHMPFLN
jgi:excisionase family DNA binding protein